MVNYNRVDTVPQKSTGNFILLSTLCTIIVIFQPLNTPPYLLPVLILLLSIIFRKSNLKHLLYTLFIIYGVSGVSLISATLNGDEINVPGYIISFITYSSLWILICLKIDVKVDTAIINKVILLLCWTVLIQFPLTIYQSTFHGDYVSGLIGVDALFGAQFGGAQTFYTLNLFAINLFLMPYWRKPIVLVTLTISFITCALAESGHQSIFFLLAIATSSFRLDSRQAAVLIVIVFFIIILLTIGFPQIFGTAKAHLDYFFSGDSAKYRSILEATSILSDPIRALTGAGLGQHSSRAAMATSGFYMIGELPNWLIARSSVFNDNLLIWVLQSNELNIGAMGRPYFTLLSIPVEMGLPISLIILYRIWKTIKFNSHIPIINTRECFWLGRMSIAGIIFLSLCMFVEVYAEIPQAIFLPLFLFFIAQCRFRTLKAGEPSKVHGTPVSDSEKQISVSR